jgi:hypothetical protein
MRTRKGELKMKWKQILYGHWLMQLAMVEQEVVQRGFGG